MQDRLQDKHGLQGHVVRYSIHKLYQEVYLDTFTYKSFVNSTQYFTIITSP
jgi:hypothetical protein